MIKNMHTVLTRPVLASAFRSQDRVATCSDAPRRHAGFEAKIRGVSFCGCGAATKPYTLNAPTRPYSILLVVPLNPLP